VPQDWGVPATKPHRFGSGVYRYGHQGWLGETYIHGRETSWIVGFRFGGQRLFIVPAFDLVVMVKGGPYDQGSHGRLQHKILLTILNHVPLASA
jgi:hypothetical protein